MNIEHLDTTTLKTPLVLEPLKDTVFVLPNNDSPIENIHITLRLKEAGIRAGIFSTFHTHKKSHLSITQEHLAPHTESHVFIKTALLDSGDFFYEGVLHIAKEARGANASQEARGLLLSEESRFKVVPALEILPKDVSCHHKASASPINSEALFVLQTKGLTKEKARAVLEAAFLKSAFGILKTWGLSENEVKRVEELSSLS